MTYENTNAFKNATELEHSNKALEKVKLQEEKNRKKGWRYVQIDARTVAHVPCDKHGNPTEEGLMKIACLKKVMGIK